MQTPTIIRKHCSLLTPKFLSSILARTTTPIIINNLTKYSKKITISTVKKAQMNADKNAVLSEDKPPSTKMPIIVTGAVRARVINNRKMLAIVYTRRETRPSSISKAKRLAL
jgi:hypothetical protein